MRRIYDSEDFVPAAEAKKLSNKPGYFSDEDLKNVYVFPDPIRTQQWTGRTPPKFPGFVEETKNKVLRNWRPSPPNLM